MTDVGRMSVQELLGKVLTDEHADLVREAVASCASRSWRPRSPPRSAPRSASERPEQRTAHSNGYRPRRFDTRAGSARAVHPQAAGRLLLPELPGAAHALRAGAGGGGDGVLRQRRVDPQGRARGRAARGRGDEQVAVSRLCAASTSR